MIVQLLHQIAMEMMKVESMYQYVDVLDYEENLLKLMQLIVERLFAFKRNPSL